jgi:hypothetical protein
MWLRERRVKREKLCDLVKKRFTESKIHFYNSPLYTYFLLSQKENSDFLDSLLKRPELREIFDNNMNTDRVNKTATSQVG